MFPFRCSRLNDSISNELRTPSVTIPTRLSSAWVTLINIIFGMKPLPPLQPRSPAVRLVLHAFLHNGGTGTGATTDPRLGVVSPKSARTRRRTDAQSLGVFREP